MGRPSRENGCLSRRADPCPVTNDLARPDALSWPWAIFNGRVRSSQARVSVERRPERRRLSLKIARITVLPGLREAADGLSGRWSFDQRKSRTRRNAPAEAQATSWRLQTARRPRHRQNAAQTGIGVLGRHGRDHRPRSGGDNRANYSDTGHQSGTIQCQWARSFVKGQSACPAQDRCPAARCPVPDKSARYGSSHLGGPD